MKAQRSIAVISFLIASWIIASLALTGDVFQTTSPVNSGLLVNMLVVSAPDIVLTVSVVFLSGVLYWIARDRKLLVERLIALFTRRKGMRTKKGNRNVTRDTIGFLLLIALIAALRNSGLLTSTQPSKAGIHSPGIATFQIPWIIGQDFQSSIIAVYQFFAVWAVDIVLMVIAGFTLMIFLQAVTQMKASKPNWIEPDSDVIQEAIEVVQKSALDLIGGNDYRASILQCYRRLCEIFDSRTDRVHLLLTARELQEIIISQLNLPLTPLATLTEVFEEARYSPHPISIRMKEDAVDSLTEIENSLRHSSEGNLQAIQ